MGVSFAASSILIGSISKLVDNRLLFSSSFLLLAIALFILDEQYVLLNYLAVALIGCSLAAAVVPTIPELIDSMKTELRIESERQGSVLTQKVSEDSELGEVRQSEVLKPTALFTVQMEQSNLSDKTSSLFMMAYLIGQIAGPILGNGLEDQQGFDFAATCMMYVCLAIFVAYFSVVVVSWYKRPRYRTLAPVNLDDSML